VSFADRLKKRAPLDIAAERPTKSALVSLCLPQMLMVDGQAQGLVNLELAPFVVGGMSALRMLDALDELFCELERHANSSAEDHAFELFGAELKEAAAVIHHHLASVDAASNQAHAEHEATHQHEKGPLH